MWSETQLSERRGGVGMLIESERLIEHRDRAIQGVIAGLVIAAVFATVGLSAREVTTSRAEVDPTPDDVVHVDWFDQVRRLVVGAVPLDAAVDEVRAAGTTSGSGNRSDVGGESSTQERTPAPGSHVDPRTPASGGSTTTTGGSTVGGGAEGDVNGSNGTGTGTADATVDTPIVGAGTTTTARVGTEGGGSMGASSSTAVTTPVTTTTAQVDATVDADTGIDAGVSGEVGVSGLGL